MFNFFSKFKYFDLPLLITSSLLLVIGLSLLYATSLSSQNMGIFYRQLTFVGFGVIVYILFSFYDYHNLAKLNRYIYPGIVLVLTIVLLLGRQIRGSSRWIDFGFFRFQPAEFAKIIVILGLARWLYLKRGQINSWASILITFIYVLIPAGLVVLEPDLGSSIILLGIWLGVLLVSQMNKKYLLVFALIAVVAGTVGWKWVLRDYQKKRIDVFMNPALDPKGRGYNVRQAIIAVGSGQIFGRGLGRGSQSQLKFLPERQTDFIFASASEEIGFVGSFTLLFLYYYLFSRLLYIMKHAKDNLAIYITGGVLFMLFGQVLINIGMNIGLVPVTGIPLPFLSYGGSALLVTCIALGIVQNIERQSRALRF